MNLLISNYLASNKISNYSKMASNDSKKSPEVTRVKSRLLNSNIQASDSDASLETNSLSADSGTEQNQTGPPETRKKKNRKGSEWEIMEGLKDGQRFESKPNLFNGYLHKKRKWPLKGWHKRYFILDNGILIYGKNPVDIKKGKLHGTLDIGLSVITTKSSRRRIDIDAEEFIYHLKAKTGEIFNGWVEQLTAHRLYRQHVITYGVGNLFNSSDRMQAISLTTDMSSKENSLQRNIKGVASNCGRVNLWVQESSTSLEKYQRSVTEIENKVDKMTCLLQQMESSLALETIEASSPNIKKDRRKFGLRKKKTKTNSVDLSLQFNRANTTEIEPSPLSANSYSTLSASHQHINLLSTSLPVPVAPTVAEPLTSDSYSNSDAVSLPPDSHVRDEFVAVAKIVLGDIKTVVQNLCGERDKLKVALDTEQCGIFSNSNQNTISLKDDVGKILQQNIDLKTRLLKIHEASNLDELEHLTDKGRYNTSLSYSSSCVSATEFFDAEDMANDKIFRKTGGEDEKDEESEVRTRSESSSEADSFSSGEGSISSESELGTELHNPPNNLDTGEMLDRSLTGRRTTLPVPRPHAGGLSLWNLLSKNIGKDLSQVSMPVALNEPLNALQRLCEELEYSELLDRAAITEDPYERMVQIAAFAVSAYASTLSRAGNKPFNPLLGETYECIREDRGFRFIAEQVSHHPPVSACYAESSNFTFWQDARIKTKFWGKSMEFQPVGYVRLLLPKTGDLYTWNKVTTCVHNLFSNQRWVDQYGELKIDNGKITCKLTFNKASYWSSKRHEVVGAVYDESGKPVRRLFGKWSESLYCGVAPSARCIWRAGNLPENHELYYGFTRFAIELNELGSYSNLLPPTDTRFRPDQRALEEGDLNAAESLKHQLENGQRERRKRREELNVPYEPRWFSNPREDLWEYNGKYWDTREKPGFSNLQFESLW
ncbi:oxysterol-binding protein-related protein 3-like isoform X2 [Anthonomus grandis grandis]|uniref:oxysterol-binding protein-related protein 3-like isoform X2 n=1 Tax=Anthonomus grandis grandis TaxID=2921223 RepID=UPI002166B626|nr:oxysterol-binding protein-related protein 3-like isoform X2 [Anthonomus grandis grandis]